MTPTTTSNDWPNWGNAPYRDHNFRYRVCVSYGDIGDYAAWDWTHRFGFNAKSTLTATREPNCGATTDALFYLTTQTYVNQVCQAYGVIACFISNYQPPQWDSYVQRWEVKSALIPIRKSYIDSVGQAMQIHIFEHELGHGFGLAHHASCQPAVMEDPPCSGYWVDTPDITTVRCVYGYAC
jgi:hypothetical protein